MLRVAMLSKWHVHAAGYAREFLSSGKAEINAVWDEKADRGEEWAKELGCDFESDLDKLLARDDIDAVCCCAPTTMHKDVIIRAAKAGKHIFTEKTLACTVAECKEIAKEIEAVGIPVAHICTVIPISESVGAKRIIAAKAIAYPTGNPELPAEDEKVFRRELIRTALKSLETAVTKPTVFGV